MTLVKFFFIYYYLKQLVVKFRFTFQKVIQSKLSEEALCGVGQIKKKKNKEAARQYSESRKDNFNRK